MSERTSVLNLLASSPNQGSATRRPEGVASQRNHRVAWAHQTTKTGDHGKSAQTHSTREETGEKGVRRDWCVPGDDTHKPLAESSQCPLGARVAPTRSRRLDRPSPSDLRAADIRTQSLFASGRLTRRPPPPRRPRPAAACRAAAWRARTVPACPWWARP